MRPAAVAIAAPGRSGRAWAAALVAILLGALLCARTLLSESYERLDVSFLDSGIADLGPTPLSAALLDALLLGLSSLLLALSEWRWSRTAITIAGALALLGAAVYFSSLVAGERGVARLSGANLWITIFAGVALSTAARDALVARFLLAGLLATGVTIATKCVLQHYFEAADTLAAWQERKQELAASGANLDDPLIVNYERRVESLARESTGFHYHANVTASCLLLALLPALGILITSIFQRSRPPAAAIPLGAAVGGMIVGVCTWGLILTGSKGAGVAAGAGALLLMLTGTLGRRLSRCPLTATLLAVLLYALVIAGGAWYGIAQGTLPIASLAFRWHYWQAALPAWREAPWTGIGRLNFADAFLRHKAPECVEDVRDPHNLWLSLLVETGPAALLAAVVMLVCTAFWATARLAPQTGAPERCENSGDSPGHGLAAALIGSAALALFHAAGGGLVTLEWAPALVWSMEVLCVWCFSLAAAWNALVDIGRRGGPGSEWMRAGLLAAAGAMLVHALVDFALMTPAGLSAMVLVAVLASAPAERPVRAAAPGGRRLQTVRSGLCILAGLALVALQLLVNVIHPASLRREIRELRSYAAHDPLEHVTSKARLATRTDDAGALRDAAEALIAAAGKTKNAERAVGLLEIACDTLNQAMLRNPGSEKTPRRQAVIFDALSQMLRSLQRPAEADAAQAAAVDAWRRAVDRSPNNPRSRIAAGRALVRDWERTGSVAESDEARAQLRRATEIDASRPVGDTVRLSPLELHEIEALQARLEGGSATTQEAHTP